ncbi:MAG: hypothetical protein QGI08_15085 [Paracoccaceae bacterium]|jgi:hypothetical protein|nr:hypothetical protein [Paracoccaceae bacterium]MDP7187040.1 hypothetical protein [Paracoccaceae bacterium]
MTKTLTPEFAAALGARDLKPVIFYEGQFASGTLRLWSGLGEIPWNGETWSGAGYLLGLGALEESTEVAASGVTISLSGVDPALVSAAIADARQGLPGKVWIGLLDENGAIIADPVQAFAGRLDVPEITDDATRCTISISYESRLIDLTTPRNWRYTHESQQVLYPGDKGLEYVAAIQDQEVTWGRG